jgi:hypothetical protein
MHPRTGEMPADRSQALLTLRDGRWGWLIAGRWLPYLAGADDDPEPPANPDPPAGAGVSPPPPADPPVTPPVASGEPTWPNGEPFDPDRAMKTIAQLREIEKAHKTASKELDELRAYRKQQEEAQLTEQERQAKRMAELEARETALTLAQQDRTLRYEAQLAAVRLGVRPEAMELAWRAVDPALVTWDDDGQPTNVETVLAGILDAHPYLKASAAPAAPAAPALTPTNPARPAAAPITAEQLRDLAKTLSPEEINARWEEFSKVLAGA